MNLLFLAGARIAEHRWDSIRQTMVYRVEYDDDVTDEEEMDVAVFDHRIVLPGETELFAQIADLIYDDVRSDT